MLSMLEADDLILNTEKLRLAMKAQKIYLSHLLLFLQDDLQVQKQDKESKADFIVLSNHITSLRFLKNERIRRNGQKKFCLIIILMRKSPSRMDKKVKLLKLNRAN